MNQRRTKLGPANPKPRPSLPHFAPRHASQPFVVAIEGANGAGKTTLCHRLSDAMGWPCRLGVDEAWCSEELKLRMIRDADWPASAMFFLSGYLEQMRCLRNSGGEGIVMGRSIWSTLAVQAATRPRRLRILIDMLRPLAESIHLPDLTIVLDASFATCTARIARKGGSARVLDELTANAAFHARERAFYRWLGRENRAEEGVLFLNVDGASADDVCEKAAAMLRERIRC